MSFFRNRDGVRLSYEDYGTGEPVVFVSGWALSADMWEYQVPTLLEHGYRCVLLDRRGHARSERPSSGYDLDTLSDDLADLLDHLDLRDATLVGHSFGGVEVAHFLARHSTERVARVAFVAACLPSMAYSKDNPNGVPAEAVEAVLATLRTDRAKWLADNTQAYFATHLGNNVSPAYVDSTIRQCLDVAPMAALWVQRENLTAAHESTLPDIDVPALVVHGTADASAPIDLTGRRTAATIPGCVYREYPNAGHGLYFTHAAQLNADLLAFLTS